MAFVRDGERRLRDALRRLSQSRERGRRKEPSAEAAPPAPPPPNSEWGWSIEERLRRMEARLGRLERLIGGGVLLTVLADLVWRALERGW
jgi:hypothetical protein